MKKLLLTLAGASLITTSAFAGYWYTELQVDGICYCSADIYDSGSYLEATIHFPDGSTHHADGRRDSRGRIEWERIRD